jgi:hypothetical protein
MMGGSPSRKLGERLPCDLGRGKPKLGVYQGKITRPVLNKPDFVRWIVSSQISGLVWTPFLASPERARNEAGSFSVLDVLILALN